MPLTASSISVVPFPAQSNQAAGDRVMNDVNLRAALELAAAGVFVFPALVTWNDAAKKLDKRPAIVGWQEAATTDLKQIRKWWGAHRDAVPGIELGRSNLFVVDLDRHPGGADGVAAFKTFRGNNSVSRD